MLKAILFDLDDTLLGNKTSTFTASYFRLLSEYAAHWLPPEQLMPALLTSSQQVMSQPDPTLTNMEQFWRAFCPQVGKEREEIEPFFNDFYQTKFHEMASSTQFRPLAVEIVDWCSRHGLHIVVATNPIFPAVAIEARLGWAGLPVGQAPFSLVTTMENSYYTKPHAGYYQGILDHIVVEPGDALMVGDDWQNDIAGAARLGVATFWVRNGRALPDDGVRPDGWGELDELQRLLHQGWPPPASSSAGALANA